MKKLFNFDNEEKLFDFLSNYCVKKEYVNWDEEFVPNEFNLNRVQINYFNEESWFFRHTDKNDKYYFFGVKKDKNHFLRAILKANEEFNKTNILFYESGNVYIYFKISNKDENRYELIKSYLTKNFELKYYNKEHKVFSILLGKYNSFSIINNIDKLIKSVIFYLDTNKRFLHITELNTYNEVTLNDKKQAKIKFINELNNYKGIISKKEMLNLKYKYNKNYFNFFDELNLDKLISKHNKPLLEEEIELITEEFNNELINHQGLISEEEISKFEKKYNKDYFPFFDELKLDKLISKHNKQLIENEKQRILKGIEGRYVTQSEKKDIKDSIKYGWDSDSLIEQHNDEYIINQMDDDFFDNVDGRSLDKNQRIAVLTDDDNTQIVAGAGTGKTLTIQAKVKYLIEKQGVLPEDILCISFSNSARDDLAIKLKRTIDAPVEVRTFHSLGYSILGINGYDREVPKYSLNQLIDTYFKEYYSEHPQEVIEFFSYYFNLIHINADNLKLETFRSKLNSLDEYDEYLQEYLQIADFKRKKEYMPSIHELIISNYLFIHNINYEVGNQLILKNKNYDAYSSSFADYIFLEESEVIPEDIKQDFVNELIDNFEKDFGLKKLDYYPNFFLPEYDIYIKCIPSISYDWENQLKGNDKENVMNFIEGISKANNSFKTKILTLFNYGDDIESIINYLENKLLENNVSVDEGNWSKLFELLILKSNLPEYAIFIKTIERFINLFKGNAKNINYYGEDISKEMFNNYLTENHELYSSSIEKRNKFFLDIIEKVYNLYSESLKENDFIDFNDMINEAIIKLREGSYIHNYQYVIVDEYQDTSHTRYNLLKEVQNVTGAKVVVVGDDWQSIYGFTGCDVSLFSQFDKYFDNPKMVKINVTRRNSQKLIDVAGEFIQKNENQIPKKLKSDKLNDFPIKIFEYNSRAEEVLAFITALNTISNEKEDAEILVLGRNNKDINEILCRKIFSTIEFQDFTKIVYEQNKKLNIEFRTVHKSKGLEKDYVFVLNLNNQINGFPNQIVNDPILDFVNNIQNENIEYPEERRLFYVALTRTKNDVYLFNRAVRPSVFVDQIRNKEGVEKLEYVFSNEDIMTINTLLRKKFEVIDTGLTCPDCKMGNINLIVNNERGTSYFKCSNFCGWDGGPHHNNAYKGAPRKISYVNYAEVCPDCGGMLVVTLNKYGNYFLGCNHYPACDTSKNLPRNFDKAHENISSILKMDDTININKTPFGVYFIDKYIPKDKLEEYSEDEIKFTKKLWDYKDDEDFTVDLFTQDLMKFITFIFNNDVDINVNKLALVPIPSSKVKRINKSSMRKSIDIIEKWYKTGKLEAKYNCNKEIINLNDLLMRVKDVPTAHLGEGRASCEQHIDSIECMEDNLSNEDIAYVVLDDITTTGNSMRACNEILLKAGVNEENIFNIAIGATVRDDNGEI